MTHAGSRENMMSPDIATKMCGGVKQNLPIALKVIASAIALYEEANLNNDAVEPSIPTLPRHVYVEDFERAVVGLALWFSESSRPLLAIAAE